MNSAHQMITAVMNGDINLIIKLSEEVDNQSYLNYFMTFSLLQFVKDTLDDPVKSWSNWLVEQASLNSSTE